VRPSRAVEIYQAPLHAYAEALELAEAAPAPAQVGNVACATAGWTDASLLKETRFYPKAARAARDRLSYYAQHFAYVEVDATYYALLPPINAQNWLAWTPSTFTFDIKAHPVLTGQPMDVARLPADLRDLIADSGAGARVYAERLPVEITRAIEGRFREFLRPLLDQNRLGALLLQFPPWFVANRGNVKSLEALAERWSSVPLAVEFRHSSWSEPERRERVLDLLRAHAISLVCTDAPAANTGLQSLRGVTNPRLAIVRLHGRNSAGWAKKGATVHERFSYLYSPEELSAWLPALSAIAKEAESVHVTFNNCYRDYAVLNAKEFASLLEGKNKR
jgi:uncharacterized protein YecE (DUF72 family)